jgi:hypothetical protein
MRPLALLAVAAVALGACGSAGSTTEHPGSSLTITFRSAPGAVPVVRTLRCRPAGGTLTRPGRACLRLASMRDAFAPIPKDMACTEIYGGPQTAVVAGTYRGKPLRATFARRNGCEIARWDRHAFLFPRITGSPGYD